MLKTWLSPIFEENFFSAENAGNMPEQGGVMQLVSDTMSTNCKIQILKNTHHPFAVSTLKY